MTWTKQNKPKKKDNNNMLLRIYETQIFAGGGTLNKRRVFWSGGGGVRVGCRLRSTEGLQADKEATLSKGATLR